MPLNRFHDFLAAFMQFNQFIGVPEYNELERKYRAEQPDRLRENSTLHPTYLDRQHTGR